MIPALLIAMILTPAARPKDDGFGVCPAFTHYHADWRTEDTRDLDPKDREGEWRTVFFDGKCHRDSDDEPIDKKPDLKRRKPKPNPNDKWL